MLPPAVHQTASIQKASVYLATLPRASTRILRIASTQQARTCFGWYRRSNRFGASYPRTERCNDRITKTRLTVPHWVNEKQYTRDLHRYPWGWRFGSSWGRAKRPYYKDEKAPVEEQEPHELSEREKMWRQHMVDLKRLFDKDPYEAIFGFSNRLRRGIAAEFDQAFKDTTEKLQDSKPSEGLTSPKTDAAQATKPSQSDAGIPKLATKTTPTAPPPVAQVGRGSSTPANTTIFTEAPLVYDPITNRMVRTTNQEFSHYGQELDVPIKPYKASSPAIATGDEQPQSTAVDAPASKARDNPPASSPASKTPKEEYNQYRSRRLPEAEVQHQWLYDEGFVTSDRTKMPFPKRIYISRSQEPTERRSKLEKDYGWVQAKDATEEGIEAWKPETKVVDSPTSSAIHNAVSSSVSLGSLGSGMETALDRMESKQPNTRLKTTLERQGPESPEVKIDAEQIRQSYKQPHGYDHARESRRAAAAEDSRAVADAKRHGIADMFKRMWPQEQAGTGHESSPPTLERRRISGKSEKLLDSEIQNYKSGVAKMGNGTTTTSTAQAVPVTSQPDTSEVSRRSAAAEAIRQEQKASDAALVKEIRNIYEQRYGAINTEHRQSETPSFSTRISDAESKANDSSATDAVRILPKSPLASSAPASNTLGSTHSTRASIQQEPQAAQPARTSTYEILAYDPSSSNVSSATVSAPASGTEKAIPLTAALLELSEPAKFLPHLHNLRQRGFEIVSSSNNLLILRQAGPAEKSEESTTTTAAAIDPAPSTPSKPLINPIDKTGTHVPTGDFASPTGFVNYNNYEPVAEVEESTTTSPKTSATAESKAAAPSAEQGAGHATKPYYHFARKPRRTEPVFSGAGRRHFDRRRGKRRVWKWIKKVAATFGITVTTLYAIGCIVQVEKERRAGNRIVYRRPEDVIRED